MQQAWGSSQPVLNQSRLLLHRCHCKAGGSTSEHAGVVPQLALQLTSTKHMRQLPAMLSFWW